ncbi:YcxB family protein [Inconstantimicrobium mannanitabidum]|uniref:YcxB family protein n=1 Tax=Inconstantimicrobium mannanitabidum TaxID=1604901 RepID=UPI0021C362A0|nr:YcxB family protein [Clostridium sp. TW13]
MKHARDVKKFRLEAIVSKEFIVLVYLILYLILPSSSEKSILYCEYVLIIMAILVILFDTKLKIYITKRKLIKMYKIEEYSSLFAEASITLNTEGVEYMNLFSETIYKWDYVRSIHEVDDYLIIMCNEQIVIPVNCFKCEDEKNNFVNVICEKTDLIVNKKFPEKFIFI